MAHPWSCQSILNYPASLGSLTGVFIKTFSYFPFSKDKQKQFGPGAGKFPSHLSVCLSYRFCSGAIPKARTIPITSFIEIPKQAWNLPGGQVQEVKSEANIQTRQLFIYIWTVKRELLRDYKCLIWFLLLDLCATRTRNHLGITSFSVVNNASVFQFLDTTRMQIYTQIITNITYITTEKRKEPYKTYSMYPVLKTIQKIQWCIKLFKSLFVKGKHIIHNRVLYIKKRVYTKLSSK